MPSKCLQIHLFTLSVRAPLKAGMPFATCNRIGEILLLSNRLFRYSSNFVLFLCLFYVSAPCTCGVFHLTRCVVTIGVALRLSLAAVCLSSLDSGDIVPDTDKGNVPLCEPSV